MIRHSLLVISYIFTISIIFVACYAVAPVPSVSPISTPDDELNNVSGEELEIAKTFALSSTILANGGTPEQAELVTANRQLHQLLQNEEASKDIWKNYSDDDTIRFEDFLSEAIASGYITTSNPQLFVESIHKLTKCSSDPHPNPSFLEVINLDLSPDLRNFIESNILNCLPDWPDTGPPNLSVVKGTCNGCHDIVGRKGQGNTLIYKSGYCAQNLPPGNIKEPIDIYTDETSLPKDCGDKWLTVTGDQYINSVTVQVDRIKPLQKTPRGISVGGKAIYCGDYIKVTIDASHHQWLVKSIHPLDFPPLTCPR